MIGESRSGPREGAMSVEQVERELARLRMNQDGTLGVRASVLNLIVVTDEGSARGVTRVVHELSGQYPSRAILMISDPDKDEANLSIELSASCAERGGGSLQVCAEQITVHVEGPPAGHLESLAGPLLIPDIPVFLWYPNGAVPHSSERRRMAALADRLILDSETADDCEISLQSVADLLDESGTPAVGDLRWASLSSWRSLVADLFAPPDRTGELAKIRRVEILHGTGGECQALLFAGWLSAALGWRPESNDRTVGGYAFHLAGPSGDVIIELVANDSDTTLSRVCLFSEEFSFRIQITRHEEHTDACSTVIRGDELVGERTVHLGSSDPGVLLGEELKILGRDKTYESALKRAVALLGS